MTIITRRHFFGLGGLAVAAVGLSACGGSGFNEPAATMSPEASGSPTGFETTDSKITVLIGSSGAAETKAVTDAVAAWSKDSGVESQVLPANNLEQQLSQGFASGNPSDVFYLSTDTLGGYAANSSLQPYGDQIDAASFYEALVAAFTVDDVFYAAPKDFSTLALIINKKSWAAAGLTDADVPTTWDDFSAVAEKLTTGTQVGLGTSPEYQRLGVWMAQAGGELVTDGKATANSQGCVDGLTHIQELLKKGTVKLTTDLGAGWGGEAFGKELCAMTIEGNWIIGAMQSDYPTVEYIVAELPAGPSGKGTLQFTNAWGLAADSKNKGASLELIKALTAPEQQLAFAAAFGVMPSVKATGEEWKTKYPEQAAFLAGAAYAKNPPAQKGVTAVISDLNAKLEGIKTADVKALLDAVQTNLEAALG
ncbi:MAG: extracellular solute-binding protein [Arachnia sp.]